MWRRQETVYHFPGRCSAHTMVNTFHLGSSIHGTRGFTSHYTKYSSEVPENHKEVLLTFGYIDIYSASAMGNQKLPIQKLPIPKIKLNIR